MWVDMMGRALEMMAVQKGPRLPIEVLGKRGKTWVSNKREQAP